MLYRNLRIAYPNETLNDKRGSTYAAYLQKANQNETLSSKRGRIYVATKFTNSIKKWDTQ